MNKKTLHKSIQLTGYLHNACKKLNYVKTNTIHLVSNQCISPSGFQAYEFGDGNIRIVSYPTLHQLLLTNFQWCDSLRRYFTGVLNSYHTSSKQLSLNYQYYKYILFNYFCSKQALQKLDNNRNILAKDLINEHNIRLNKQSVSMIKYIKNNLLYIYYGNYQFKLLTIKDKPYLNHILINQLHGIFQLCIVPLFFNISSKRLAKMSGISKSKIKQLQKPYSQQWELIYKSLTYTDAKILSQIGKDYVNQYPTRDLHIPPVVDYRKILTKIMPKRLQQSQKMFKENRMSSLKEDILNGWRTI